MIKNFMKIALGLFVLVSFSACNKDYTCTCTTSVDGETVGSPSSFTITDNESGAKETCDAGDVTSSSGGSEGKSECSID